MRKILFVLLFVMVPLLANADVVEIDGIYYNLISKSKTAEVTYREDSLKYTGDISIPSMVEYGGTTYSVASIGAHAFWGCNQLKSITIPWGVTSIGHQSFGHCESLTSLEVPGSVQELEFGAFMHCYNLISVVLGEGVATIGDSSFEECRNLKSINFPQSIVHVGSEAFFDCKMLENIYITDIASYCNIQFNYTPYYGKIHLFLNNQEIKELNIPEGVTSLYYNFHQCAFIETITLPQTMESIIGAFSGCVGLKEITLPESVKKINGAFTGCIGLEKITIPCNVIETYDAFVDCSNLKEVHISQGVKSINEFAFAYCNNLKTVYVSSTVSKIEHGAFQNCSELENFYCYSDKINADNDIFKNSYINYATLYIPYGTKDFYSNNDPWKYFGYIIELPPNVFTLTYLIDEDIYKSCEVEAGKPIIPEAEPVKEGYSFSGWSGLPEIMPSHDVTVTGSFTINQYVLKYVIDGETYKTQILTYGTTIIPEPAPMKEGYTFSGWNDIPTTMPSHDVTVTGSFTINKYKLTYLLDWQEIKTTEMIYGTTITPEPNPSKEGYMFTGWSCLPEKMPARDVTAYGAFYQSGRFMYGFKWEEEETNSNGAPLITLAVGEKHRIKYSYSSSDMPDDIFYLTQTGNWVTYERKYLQDLGNTDVVVECPEMFSISPSGVITAHKEGLAALKPTGYIQSEGGYDRCYIQVVTNYEEKEPNNDLTYANELKSAPTRFCLMNIADQDFFKVKAKAGDKISFKVTGDHTSHLGYKWNTISPSGKSIGGGGLLTDEETGEREITIENSLTQNLGNGYYYLQIYFNQSISQYFVNNDYLTVQAFINDEPIKTKIYFNLKYKIDENDYKIYSLEEGESIIPEPTPEKEGYTFSGWNQIPATMPAHDVTVTGTFMVNKYQLTYIVDGEEYKTYEVNYGADITPEPDPEKEGYSFSGWSEIPETMPAKSVIVTGTFSINRYTLTYMIDEFVYKQMTYEYGAMITREPQPEGDYVSFEWVGVPETMPAHDVTVTAVYETGIAEIKMIARQGQMHIYSPNGKKQNKLQKGLNIVLMLDGTTKKVVVK